MELTHAEPSLCLHDHIFHCQKFKWRCGNKFDNRNSSLVLKMNIVKKADIVVYSIGLLVCGYTSVYKKFGIPTSETI